MTNISRRHFITLGVSAAALAAFAGCAPVSTPQTISIESQEPESGGSAESVSSASVEIDGLAFSTGLQSGTYYHFGKHLAEHAESAAGLKMTVLASDGSKANVDAIAKGTADFALCQSDVVAYAYEGIEYFEGAPIKELSVVSYLYEEMLQIVTCDPKIASVSDLEGKRVSIGTANSGVYLDAIKVLDAYGLSETDIVPTYQSFADATESLKEDEIDAAFIVSAVPTQVLTDLAAEKKTYLIPLDEAHVSKIVADNPHLSASFIPAQTYKGQVDPVATVTSAALLVASNETSADDVYAFVSDIYASIEDPAVVASYDKYQQLSVEKGASMSVVPYHPGAVRFFAEKGIAVS